MSSTDNKITNANEQQLSEQLFQRLMESNPHRSITYYFAPGSVFHFGKILCAEQISNHLTPNSNELNSTQNIQEKEHE